MRMKNSAGKDCQLMKSASEYAPLIGWYGLQYRFCPVIGWSVGEIYGADWPTLITSYGTTCPKIFVFWFSLHSLYWLKFKVVMIFESWQSVFIGEKDEMISLYSAARIEQVAASEDKKIFSYPRGHHMLHLEESSLRLQFIKDLISWITERTPPPGLG